MNNRLSLEFGQSYVRIPLRKSPHIHPGDALETDWNGILRPEDCSYVFGNPPFAGAKYQSAQQREQVRRVAALGGSGGTLDYVAAWFIRAAEYIQNGRAHIGFVATNSLTQGEQVAQLWPQLFDRFSLEISFAHRTFAWGSDARGQAHVHVVIIGLSKRGLVRADRRLLSYDHVNGQPHESKHAVLTPYLFDGARLANPHLVVSEAGKPLNGLPRLKIGSKPIDGGHYIFDEDQRRVFLGMEPGAAPFMRPFIGSKEFLNGQQRYILALHDARPEALKRMPHVMNRIEAVKAYRRESDSPPTRELANTPTRYHVNVLPSRPFLIVPGVSSEDREYVPIAWMEPPTIPSNLVQIIENATLELFGLLTSAMHMSWLRHIGGRLKSDYRYSIGLVYNTFPLPPVSASDVKRALEPCAQAVLGARKKFARTPLGDLYDSTLMPASVRKAHQSLDRAVDRLYRRAAFTSDRERAEHLLSLYEKMVNPLQVVRTAPAKRTRPRS